MKNQYAGDVNDFRKYGLIRCLTEPEDLSVFCCWMLTPNDGSTDGRHVSYLEDPARWKGHDSDLFDAMAAVVGSPDGRGVRAVEDAGVLRRASFFDRILPDGRTERASYFGAAQPMMSEADLVFFDPDNGFEIKSRPQGRKDSSKYLFWDEVALAFRNGASVLAYQHFPRQERTAYTRDRAFQLRTVSGASWTASFATSHVVFLLAPQLRHEFALMEGCRQVQARWGDQFTVRLHRGTSSAESTIV